MKDDNISVFQFGSISVPLKGIGVSGGRTGIEVKNDELG